MDNFAPKKSSMNEFTFYTLLNKVTYLLTCCMTGIILCNFILHYILKGNTVICTSLYDPISVVY